MFTKDTAKDSMATKTAASVPATHRHGGVRLQMAESGHEDEHANLLGDEGMRPSGGQVLKLGYPHQTKPKFLLLFSCLVYLERSAKVVVFIYSFF